MDLLVFLTLLAIGYFAGTIFEKSHYASIKKREKEFLNLPTLSVSKEIIKQEDNFQWAFLASGSAVISLDYFKRMLALLRNFFGGPVRSYETLIDRARREAVLRMKEKAKGADMILNLRIETSSIGKNAQRKKTIGSVEALAYGTAVIIKEGEAA